MSLSAPSIPRVCEALCTELCARLGPLLRTVLYTALYPGLCVMLALGCYRSHERGGDGGEGAPRDAAARDGAAPFDGGAPFDAEAADGASRDASAPVDAWPGIDAPFDGRVEHCRVAPGFHLVQDMPNRLVHLMIHTVVPGQQLGQRTVKVALGGVQSGDSVGHFSDPVLE